MKDENEESAIIPMSTYNKYKNAYQQLRKNPKIVVFVNSENVEVLVSNEEIHGQLRGEWDKAKTHYEAQITRLSTDIEKYTSKVSELEVELNLERNKTILQRIKEKIWN